MRDRPSVTAWFSAALAVLRRSEPDLTNERGRSRERYRRAAMGTIAAIGARGVGAMTSLVTVPLTLGYLGVERYGMWMTISSLALILVFTDLGLGNGLLTAVANAHGRDDRTLIGRLTASGFWMLAGVAGLLAVLLVGTYPIIDWAGVLNVSDPRARSEAAPAMLVFGLLFAASLPLAAAAQVRQAHQEAHVNSVFVAAGSLLGLLLAIVAIVASAPLPVLVMAFMSGPLLAGVANSMLLFGRQRPDLRPVLSRFHGATARRLLGSGSQFLLLQLAMAAAFYADAVIAARVIGPEAVAEYSVVARLFLVPTVLATAVLAPLWAAYGEAAGRGDVAWLRGAVRRSLMTMLVITVPICGALTVFGQPLIGLWVGGAVSPPGLLIAGMATWTVLSAVGSALAIPLNALHMLKLQIVTAIAMAVLNVSLSVYLASQIGVAGVILGTVIAYPIATLVPLGIFVPRALRGVATGRQVEPTGARTPRNLGR